MGDQNKETKAYEAQVLQHLANESVWQIRTDAGLWVCPFCAALGANWQRDTAKMKAEVLGHLFFQCPKFQRGKGREKPLDELKARARLYNLSKRVKHDAAMQVIDRERRWYSPITGLRQPFCIREDRPSRSELMHIQKHLDENPLPAGEAPLSKEQLEISVRIHTDSRFRCFDTLGRWYNPFTLKPTDVMLDESRRITRAQIAGIHERLVNGIEYVTFKGNPPHTLDNIQDAVKRGDKKARLARDIKSALRSDPVWTVVGNHGLWICPFCRYEVSSVHLSSPFLLKEIAPRQMAQHLVDECSGYRQSVNPATTVSELGGTPLKKDSPGTLRVHYEAAAATFDAMEKTREEQATINARILEARHSEDELQNHRKVQVHQKQVMERARQVQLGMLPKVPTIPGLEIVVHYLSCDEVGGDFYDFVEVGPDEVGIVIGDVSGHGVHAALVMAASKKSLKIHGKGVSSPRQALMIVNDDLRPELPPSIFVTIFYGVLNLKTHTLTFVRAGHNPLLIYNPARPEKLLNLEPGGMIVGMAPSIMFGKTLKEETIQLRPGDIVLQYTDGVTEAMDPQNEEYGEERLVKCFERFSHLGTQAFVEQLVADVEEFRAGAEINDDITLVALKVLASAAAVAAAAPAPAPFAASSESLPTAVVTMAADESLPTGVSIAPPPVESASTSGSICAATVGSQDIVVEFGDLEAAADKAAAEEMTAPMLVGPDSSDALAAASASTASIEFTFPGSEGTSEEMAPLGDFASDDSGLAVMLPTGFGDAADAADAPLGPVGELPPVSDTDPPPPSAP